MLGRKVMVKRGLTFRKELMFEREVYNTTPKVSFLKKIKSFPKLRCHPESTYAPRVREGFTQKRTKLYQGEGVVP